MMLNNAHPIYDEVIEATGFDARLVDVTDYRNLRKDAHDNWLGTMEVHYATMRAKDERQMSGEYDDRTRGNGWLAIKQGSHRADRVPEHARVAAAKASATNKAAEDAKADGPKDESKETKPKKATEGAK